MNLLMSKHLSVDSPRSKGIWESIVDDLLEISCLMAKQGREHLCAALRKRQIVADRVEMHPCFSIERFVVVVSETKDIEECWIYNPKQRKINRLRKVSK